MKSILMLLALAFLVFQIEAKPQETLDTSDDNDFQETGGPSSENETVESEENSQNDSEEKGAIVQPRSRIFCTAAGGVCRQNECRSFEKKGGYCLKGVPCCLSF